MGLSLWRNILRLQCLIASTCALICLAAPASASAEEELGGAVRLSFQHFDGSGEPSFETFSYLNLGFRLDHRLISFDMDTIMPIVLLDGIATLFRYIAGGPAELPLYSALNGAREDGAWIPFFSMSGRYNLYYNGKARLGAGPQIRYGLLSPYYNGTRLGLTSFDAGFHVIGALELERARLRATLAAGNGWTDEADWNPYVGAGFEVEVPVWEWVGVFVRGAGRQQRYDRRAWSNTNLAPGLDPALVRRVGWWTLWSVDAGAAVLF